MAVKTIVGVLLIFSSSLFTDATPQDDLLAGLLGGLGGLPPMPGLGGADSGIGSGLANVPIASPEAAGQDSNAAQSIAGAAQSGTIGSMAQTATGLVPVNVDLSNLALLGSVTDVNQGQSGNGGPGGAFGNGGNGGGNSGTYTGTCGGPPPLVCTCNCY